MAPRKRAASAASKNPSNKSHPEGQNSSPGDPGQKSPQNPMEELEDFTLDDLPLDTEPCLQDFLIRNELLDKSFYVRVYRYDNDNETVKTFCGRYTDHAPDEHEIGMDYGSGRYITILQVTDSNGQRRGTTKKMKIDPSYDELRQQKLLPSLQGQNIPMMQGNGLQNQNAAMDSTMKMFGMVIAMLQPLLKTNPVSQAPEHMNKLLAENYKDMNEIMKGVYLDKAQMFSDMARSEAGLTETVQETEESSGLGIVVDSIISVVDKFLPSILQKGEAGRQTVQSFKEMPGYEALKKNRGAVTKLVSFIESKHGSEVAAKVCKKFGIRKPKNLTEVKQTQAGTGKAKRTSAPG